MPDVSADHRAVAINTDEPHKYRNFSRMGGHQLENRSMPRPELCISNVVALRLGWHSFDWSTSTTVELLSHKRIANYSVAKRLKQYNMMLYLLLVSRPNKLSRSLVSGFHFFTNYFTVKREGGRSMGDHNSESLVSF